MPRPSKLPEWALVESNDPTTGQPNISEPSTGIKNSGFTYNEKPPRQYFNWLFNTINKWVSYLDERTITPPISLPGRYSIGFNNGLKKWSIYRSLGVGVYDGVEKEYNLDSFVTNISHVFCEINFKKPEYNLLNVSFVAVGHSGLNGRYLNTIVCKKQPTANSNSVTIIDISSLQLSDLTSGDIRSIQLDLSSADTNDDLTFLHVITIGSADIGTDISNLTFGQLYTSWE